MASSIEKAIARQGQKTKDDANSQPTEPKQEDMQPTQDSHAAPDDETSQPSPAVSQTKVLKIDIERLENNGHVSTTGLRKKINDEYREIKRKLLSNAFGPISSSLKNSNIIMVTSARPSEGKTFTAVNLALSIAAEQDKTVLLVDADVLKPNVLRTLGLNGRAGLMEYLIGEVDDISEVLHPTNIDKLRVVPAGKSHHLSTELLASKKMHDTIDEFANRYSDRVVIIDTPPLIGITESAVLANFAGQAVVVVEESRSRMIDIKHAVERLNPDMAVGFVVNKSLNTDNHGVGYYGYYYREEDE